MKIPAKGLTGSVLMREAVTEYRAIIDLIRGALSKRLYPTGPDQWVNVEAVYADRAIVETDQGHLFQFSYTINAANEVILGDAIEVKEEFTPLKEALKNTLHAVSTGEYAFVEAVGEANSGKWLIRVIKAGISGNNNFYSDAALRESLPLFENSRVFIKSDDEHLKGEGKAVNNLIGRLVEAKFTPGTTADTGDIVAILEFIEPDGAVATKVREAFNRGMSSLFGFSIDTIAKSKKSTKNGVAVREATKITKVLSVDLIVEPGAGGQLIRMVEAQADNTDPLNTNQNTPPNKEQNTMKVRMLEAIKKASPAAFALINQDTITDDQLEAAYREATIKEPTVGGTGVAELIRMVECRAEMKHVVTGSNLPQAAKDKLITDFSMRESFKAEDVATAIDGERAYLGKFTESGKPVIHFDAAAHITESRSDKVDSMLDAFLDVEHKDHAHTRSFRECYVEITGDRKVTGRIGDCDRNRLRESVGANFRESLDSSSFANVLGMALTRRMIANYNVAEEYDIYKKLISNPVPLNDFRSQERVRYGGYGDLPIVGERDPYASLSSPTDEKATYAPAKRGGTEDITLEMVKNDDVGLIMGIPVKLGRAAKRTLSKFVLDFIRTNPVIYDTYTLFHATHGNLGTAALDATALTAARQAMLKQTEKDSNDRLGIEPKVLWTPTELEDTGNNLFNRNTNLDKTFIQNTNLEVVRVWYWTDATDWAVTANPLDAPLIELGFLDGKEEPELFVQDSNSVGSLFNNDTITWKIRHIYGGAVLDYRGAYKSVVAG